MLAGRRASSWGRFPPDPAIWVREGFSLSIAQADIEGARFMAFAPDGTLFVSQPDRSRILACRDENGDGYYEKVTVFVKGHPYGELVYVSFLTQDERVLGRPVDVVVAPNGSLLISDDEGGRIYRLSYGRQPSGATP